LHPHNEITSYSYLIMQFSKIIVFGALTLLAGADGAENRELRRSKGPKGCTPSALEGVWTHMSQGVSLSDDGTVNLMI
jgi:hypothetical protein